MALSFVGTGGFVAGAAAISVTAPSGGAQGDLILLFISTANQAPPSTPTLNGVAMTAVDNIGTGTAGAAGAVALYEYRAVRGTTDFTAEVGDSGSYQAAVMIYLRGQHATTPLGTPAKRVDAASTLTVTWPNPGSPSAGQFVVQAIALDQDANNAALDVFGPTPSFLGYVANGVIGDTTFDTGAITNVGAGGGLWIGVFNSNYSLSGGNYSTSTTHAQIAHIVDVAASADATFTTTTGSATAGAGEGSMRSDVTLTTTEAVAVSGGGLGALTAITESVVYVDSVTVTVNYTAAQATHAVFNTDPGNAAAAGGSGALLAGFDGTFTGLTGFAVSGGQAGALTGGATFLTTEGDAAAGGGTGALTGTTSATFTTTTGDAVAAGGTGAFTGASSITFTTTIGNAAAEGGIGAFTGVQNVVFTTTTGAATGGGGIGAFIATGVGDFGTLTGNASAAGGSGSFTGTSGATFTTTSGDAAASGGTGLFRVDVIWTTTTGDAVAGGGTGLLHGQINIVFTTITGDATAEGWLGRLLATSPQDGKPVPDPRVAVVSPASSVAVLSPELGARVESYAGGVRVMQEE